GPPSGLGTALLTTGPVAGCRGRNGRPRPSIRPSATPYRGHHFAIWREVFNSTVSVTSADQAVGAATGCAAASGRVAPPRCASAAGSQCAAPAPVGGNPTPGSAARRPSPAPAALS